MSIVERVKNILITPKKEWAVIAEEQATPGSIFTTFVLPLAAVPAIAGFIGMSILGFGVLGTTIRVPLGTGLSAAIVRYIASVASVYVLGLILDALAPNFGGERSRIQALKVAAYSSTAAWVAGIFLLLPGLGALTVLGLYSLYLLYLGLPMLMKAPEEKAMGYTVVAVLAAVVLYAVVGAIAGRITGYGWMY